MYESYIRVQTHNYVKSEKQLCANVLLVQVNMELLTAYWNIGRIIVEHEQASQEKTAYGKPTLRQLSKELTKEFGNTYKK